MNREEGELRLKESVKIELELNLVQYYGVGLGNLVQKVFAVYLFRSKAYTLSSALIAVAQLWLSVLSKFRFRPNQLMLKKLVIVYYSGKPKDVEILKGVTARLNDSIYLETVRDDFITSFTVKEVKEWLSGVFGFFRQANRALKKLEKDKILSFGQRIVLLHTALTNALRVSMIRTILKRNKPELMLFTYDRDHISALIAATANSMGIKTAGIVHGSTFHIPAGFVPPITEDVLCWGELQQQMFETYGADTERIKIVGFPKFRRITSEESALVRAKYSIAPDTRVMLLASSSLYGQKDSEFMVIEHFINSFVGTTGSLLPVVKLHPARYQALIPRIKKQFPTLTILPEQCTAMESLALADVVFNLASTFGIDALAAGRPVCVFNPTHFPDEGIGGLLRDNASARYATSSEELHKILLETERSPIEDVFNKKENQLYLRKLCLYLGDESVNRLLAYIRETI